MRVAEGAEKLMSAAGKISASDAEKRLRGFFPASALYSRMTAKSSAPAESREDDRFSYSERHLQCVWYDPSLRPGALRSASGEEVVVEDPGRWNLEAGPDFFDATLAIGPERRKIRGDIEIHVRPRDWQVHGHAEDPAYRRVVAHVTYFPEALSASSLPTGAVQISLRDVLKSNPAFSFESVDVTAYPYASLSATLPACGEILASWEPSDRVALLEAAGEERLMAKACRIAENIEREGDEQALYEEIMRALGYKHNRLPFRQLALRLPIETLRLECEGDAVKAYSLLLGVGGLLPSRTSRRWDDEARAFVRRLWDDWWKEQSRWETKRMSSEDWHLVGLRPQNHPARRLAAAAALFAGRETPASFFAGLDRASAETWFREAEEFFRKNSSMEFWRRRLTFSSNPQPGDIELLGSARISAILSNVVVPFLAATGAEVGPLTRNLPPEEDNNLIRWTAYALFGRDHNPELHRTGLRQQGLLQIFHDFCLNNKTACRDCRLAGALKKA